MTEQSWRGGGGDGFGLGEVLVDEGDCHAALADAGSDAFDRLCATLVSSSMGSRSSGQLAACTCVPVHKEAEPVALDGVGQPAGLGDGPDEKEQPVGIDVLLGAGGPPWQARTSACSCTVMLALDSSWWTR